MADEFEDRLKVAAERVRAERETAAAAQAQRARAQEARVAKLTAAIQDWNNRISPIIEQAITRTNQLMGDTGIQLASMPMQPIGQVAPGHAARLPSLCISLKSLIDQMNGSYQIHQSLQRVGPRTNVAQRRAAEAQRKARQQALDQAARLVIAMNEDALLVVSCHNYKVKVEGKNFLPASEFGEKAVKDLVAEFVSAGLLGIDNPPIPQRISTEEATEPPPPPSAQSFDAADNLIAGLEPRAGNAVLSGEFAPGDASISAPATVASIGSTLGAARTAVGKALLQNQLSIELIASTLLSFIDDKLESLQRNLPNSDEAIVARDQEIAECEGLKRKVEAFLTAAEQFYADKTKEKPVIDATTSFENGVRAWWIRSHVQICDKAFDMGLFTLGLSLCALAGSGGALAAVIPGVLIGGKPVVEALKIWSKTNKK